MKLKDELTNSNEKYGSIQVNATLRRWKSKFMQLATA